MLLTKTEKLIVSALSVELDLAHFYDLANLKN